MKFFIPCLLLAGLTAGCTSIPTAGLDDPEAQLPDNAGIVAVQVVSNIKRLSKQIPHWKEVIVLQASQTEAEKQHVFSIPAMDTGYTETRAFVGGLAPGTYRIAGLWGQLHTDNGTYTLSASVPREMGRFQVETGRLSTLGTLVFQPFDELSTSLTESTFLISRLPDVENLEALVKGRFPDKYSELVQVDPLDWEPDSNSEYRNAVSQLVRSHAYTANVQPPRPDGTRLIGGLLGSIFALKHGATWERHLVPTSHAITAVSTFPNGRILAGAERGQVFVSGPELDKWVAFPLPSRDGFVSHIGALTEDSWYAISDLHDSAELWRRSFDQDWERVAVIERDSRPSDLFDTNELFVIESIPDNERIAAVVTIWSGESKYTFYPRRSGIQKIEVSEWDNLEQQPNGIWSGRPAGFWSSIKKPSYSIDQGDHWIEVESDAYKHKSPPFVLQRDHIVSSGHPSRLDESLQGGRALSRSTIYGWESTSNGRRWKLLPPLPEGCTEIERQISTRTQMFCITEDGRIMQSSDIANSWQHATGGRPPMNALPVENTPQR